MLFGTAAGPAGAADFVIPSYATRASFTLPALGGGDITLAARPGETVLVHFFATWCEPCREEFPALARLARRGGAPLKVLAIAVAEPDSRVQRFVEPMAAGFPVLLDRDRAVAKAWQVSSLPTTFVLNSDLMPRLVVEADYAWDSVDPKQLIVRASQPGDVQHQQNTLTQNKEDHGNALR